MEDWWLPASVLLGTLLVGFLVYWFVIRKPTAPSSSCTVGTDCSSNVSTKDPQWLSYMWDSSCNCNLVSCQSGYDVSGGKCVASSGPTPTPTDIAINGLITAHPVYKSTQSSISDCASFCGGYSDCKVYSFDGSTCGVYTDYSIGDQSQWLDNVLTSGTNVTYVRPFPSSNPQMGKGQLVDINKAAVVSSYPYYTSDDGNSTCQSKCMNDDACDAAYTLYSNPNHVCKFYKNIDKVKNIAPASGTSSTYVKVRSSL